MEKEENKLQSILTALYEAHMWQVSISPTWLATEAIKQLDPEERSPPLVYLAAHLQLRQMGRKLCAEKFQTDSSDEQHELWPALQRRYPRMSRLGEEPQYVLLEYLNEEDVRFNVKRMRFEGRAKLQHADALEAWWANRKVDV